MMLNKRLRRFYRGQRGITGLETAIILIAFVVVASVFAYTVLSAGVFSTQKSQEAVYSGMEETQSTMQLKGAVIGYADERTTVSGSDYNVDTNEDDSIDASDELAMAKVEFTVSNAIGGEPIDLTPPYSTANMTASNVTAVTDAQDDNYRTLITYNDANTFIEDCAWTLDWIGKHDSDNLLEEGEKAVITVWLHYLDSDADGYGLGTDGNDPFIDESDYVVQNDHTFTVEVKPQEGATLTLERTTPGYLDTSMNLN
ncbi:MAG: archaellin/type IV pilin N-terminal domain-containing protein [Dehalococcoidia bacterium]